MNISDLLGAVMQSGMNPATQERLRNALGGARAPGAAGASGGLGGLGGLGDLLGGLQRGTGGGASPAGGGLGDLLGNVLGGLGGLAGQGGGAGSNQGGGLGGVLGQVLAEAGRSVGGKQNVGLGGLGALAGAILGGGKGASKGALGGGALALLAAIAFQALKSQQGGGQGVLPLGLREPENATEAQQLEQKAEWVLQAMINAAKADGHIDEDELRRIVGKLQENGADDEAQQYVLAELRKPLDTRGLVAAVRGNPQWAAEIYAASLLAIQVDTAAERNYLDELGQALGLADEARRQIETFVGLHAA